MGDLNCFRKFVSKFDVKEVPFLAFLLPGALCFSTKPILVIGKVKDLALRHEQILFPFYRKLADVQKQAERAMNDVQSGKSSQAVRHQT